MVVCPSCKNEEIGGALFCTECGTQLVTSTGSLTRSIKKNERDNHQDSENTLLSSFIPSFAKDCAAALRILDAGDILPMRGRDEFTLGRAVEGQPILPDVDLSPFNAYERGVSRLHALLKLSGNSVTLTDLGSVNGTRLNGNKLVPNQPKAVNSGDILTLGNLKVQIIVNI